MAIACGNAFILKPSERDPSASMLSWELFKQAGLPNGIFNIDCYGFGISADDPRGGHIPGDQLAALEAQRALRLVRNILMHDSYTHLGMIGLVASRWPQSVNVFQPQYDGRELQNVVGSRIALSVRFNEFSPQTDFDNLEYVSAVVNRASDGQLLVGADYQYPLP